MRWFRYYAEALDDEKVQRLSAPLFKHWVNLLCVASYNEGRIPTLEEAAFRLRLTQQRAQETVDQLVSRGLLDSDGVGWTPHNWNGRQFTSDNRDSDGRRRHDEARRKEGAVWKNPPPLRRESAAVAPRSAVTEAEAEAEAETDTETEAEAEGAAAALALLTNLYENEIGTLTPVVADNLRDWAGRIPENRAALIEYAFCQATSSNHRSWSYVQAILKRLEADGWPVEPEHPTTDVTDNKEARRFQERYESGKARLRG